MKISTYYFTLAFVLISCHAAAQVQIQQEKKRVEASVYRGQVVIFSDASLFDNQKDDTWYLNFGGPSVRVQSGKHSAGLFFAPTMRMDVSDKAPKFTPVVGFGVELGYKRFLFSVCEFYRIRPAPKKNVWEMAVGMGYKIGK